MSFILLLLYVMYIIYILLAFFFVLLGLQKSITQRKLILTFILFSIGVEVKEGG